MEFDTTGPVRFCSATWPCPTMPTTECVLVSRTMVRITKSSITGNGTGLLTQQTAQIVSFGDNSIAGNTSDGSPTSTIALK